MNLESISHLEAVWSASLSCWSYRAAHNLFKYLKIESVYLKTESGYLKTESVYLKTKSGYLKTESVYLKTESGYLKTESFYLKTESVYLLKLEPTGLDNRKTVSNMPIQQTIGGTSLALERCKHSAAVLTNRQSLNLVLLGRSKEVGVVFVAFSILTTTIG